MLSYRVSSTKVKPLFLAQETENSTVVTRGCLENSMHSKSVYLLATLFSEILPNNGFSK
jgi:hypothetical protein